MAYYAFDPIAVETEMVKAGLLPPRADVLPSKLGLLEKHFTEKDPRKWALWRISMIRQFQPAVLRQLTSEDLLYLAGQSSEDTQVKRCGGSSWTVTRSRRMHSAHASNWIPEPHVAHGVAVPC
jgi:hypothetical protein